MTILEKIINHKSLEVAERKQLRASTELEKSPFFESPVISLKAKLDAKELGIIAEIKRKSPSRGIINDSVNVLEISQGYAKAGVSAISVLTDEMFFGGTDADLTLVKQNNNISILRKDFIIDEYQLLEAKSIGADLILLIASALEVPRLKQLAAFAKSLGLEVLMETVSREEIEEYTCEDVDFIGVNNRNLKDFTQKLETSFELSGYIDDRFHKVAESSISEASQVVALQKAGYDAFLIGETFMKAKNPELACAKFIEEVKSGMQN